MIGISFVKRDLALQGSSARHQDSGNGVNGVNSNDVPKIPTKIPMDHNLYIDWFIVHTCYPLLSSCGVMFSGA